MLALELTDIRDFMNKLLRSEIFDHFLLQEGVITSAASYVIDGHINKGFYSAEELEELGLADCTCLPYSMLRTQCFDLIKGKKTPSNLCLCCLRRILREHFRVYKAALRGMILQECL